MAEETPAARATKTPQPTSTRPPASGLRVDVTALKGLEISVWHPWYGVEAGLFEQLVKDFNETNSWGIQVASEGMVNFANLYENVNRALPTEDKPALVIALPEHALEWNENRVIRELTAYISDPVYGMETGDIPSLFLEQDQKDGAQISMPAQRTARILLWNETWAKELGFKSPPDTPEEFEQQTCSAQKFMLKDESPQNDYKGGWLVDTEPMTAYAWMLAFEGSPLEGNDYRFLSPQNIDTFRFLRALSEKSCAWQGKESASYAFANREALLITASLEDLPGVARALAQSSSSDQWRAIAFPGIKQDALVVYGSSYVILDSSEEETLAAWLFVRWLLEEKQDRRFVEATHLYPIRAASMDVLGDYQKTHPQWRQAVDLLPQGRLQPQLASWRNIKTMLGDGFLHMYRVNIPSGQIPMILAQMEVQAREISR